MDITNLSAYEMKEKIKNKEITVEELTKIHLDRINQEDEARVFAFITIDNEGALERAREIDEKIAQGEELGLLGGLPIVVKDNISTQGLRTTCGSKMLRDYLPPFDASVIEFIKEEDGVILGKTNLDEFAVGSSTEASFYGATKNPVDKEKVAGGSSGGSASAVGSRQAVFGLGTDTGGSVRQPAAFCNVVGIKPSYGSISRYGVVSMANTMDQVGVFARDVKDAHLILSSLMRFDERDSSSYRDSQDILAGLDMDQAYDFKGMKIGFPIEFRSQIVDESVRNRMEEIIEGLRSQGALVEAVDLKHIEYAPACYHVISTAELSSNMARYDGIIYGHRSDDYEDLEDLYTKSRSQALGKEVKRRIILGTYLLDRENREKYYNQALRVRRLIRDDFEKAFQDYDLILTPTSPVLPFKLGEKIEDSQAQYQSDLFTVAVNLAGLPAISLPAGMVDKLPFGIQFIARQYGDADLIRAGLAFEGGNI